MRDSLWDFNRFSLGKPCQKRLLSKRQLLMLIDLNMNPSPQGGFIVAQDRSFLKPRRSGKSGTSQIVSFEHAKASAALAASCKRASRRSFSGKSLATGFGLPCRLPITNRGEQHRYFLTFTTSKSRLWSPIFRNRYAFRPFGINRTRRSKVLFSIATTRK